MMFLDPFYVEIKPNCSVSKPLYSKSKKGHYLQNTCHFEIINTLSWKPLRKSLLFSVFRCIHSFSTRNCIRWHAPSNISHRAKLWRAVPVSLDAPSFTKDTVMVSSTAQHWCFGNSHLLYCQYCFGGSASQMQPWGLLTATTIFTSAGTANC